VHIERTWQCEKSYVLKGSRIASQWIYSKEQRNKMGLLILLYT